jgi:predicted nuclease of restriction endonuclease-like (RecB) superfamily
MVLSLWHTIRQRKIMETTTKPLSGLHDLVHAIEKTNQFFLEKVQQQVNSSLTLRNWMIGCYIIEYENNGKDRAEYGKYLFDHLAKKISTVNGDSLRRRHLYICRALYLTYPQIVRSPTAQSHLIGFQDATIVRTLSAQLPSEALHGSIDPNLLLTHLSFTHFVELLNLDTPLQRHFYELQTIRNNWSVRELKRAINSMQFERTGLSTVKSVVMREDATTPDLRPENILRSPYLLEFLGLDEKPAYTETDLESAIIAHLQAFLLELGRGFCFEGRQKRITFGNTHYRIDLVFYHRILKCHVLIDLKIGEFTHADAGQMNVYLNYYKENETQKGDNPPIGIILCAGKEESLVKYGTTGLSQKVFVSKYLTNLPSEADFQKVIEEQTRQLP